MAGRGVPCDHVTRMSDRGRGYVIEEGPEGRTLVVTGPWTGDAASALSSDDVDGLVLNYARGYSEGNLELLDETWRLRRLDVLDRGISDLEPLERVAHSLEDLSIQAAPDAELDLGGMPQLRAVAGEWVLVGRTLGAVDSLRRVITWRFDEADLHAFRNHVELQRLTIKDAPHLGSLAGVANLPELADLDVSLARALSDIGDVGDLASSLREVKFQDCPGIDLIDDVEPLRELRFFGVSECGEIESLSPVLSLQQMETFYAWGSTRIADGDLSPLAQLPRLREVRMRDRRGYKPRVRDLAAAVF